MTLQRRVWTALASLVALFVVAQGMLAYLSLEEQEDRIADELVLAEARQLAIYAERGDLDGPRAADILERGGDIEAWLVRRDGEEIPEPVPATLATLPAGPHRARDGSRHLHVVAMPTSAGRLVVAYDAERTEQQVRQYGLYLLGVGALCIAAAVATARHLARIVVAPLDRLTGRLSAWVPGEPGAAAVASDEEARLLDAFGRVQARFEDAIAREREFGANLRHELRTPLAALRTDLELLADSPELAPAARARVDRMTRAVDALGGAFETAGALTRRAPARPEPVDLAGCVDDAWLTLEPAAQSLGLEFRNRVAAGLSVVADRHALLTIVRNLLRNAAEHAAPARCTVSGDAIALVVEDDGPGVAPHELPFVFDRAWRGARADRPDAPDAGGRGLGLAIARQIAELNGWSLRAEARPGGGLRFVLAFAGGTDR
jgi:signal transduction histidine kinase